VLEVISFLEEELGITVDDDDATPDDMESIDRIAASVARKLCASVPEAQAMVGSRLFPIAARASGARRA
jgi:hypothetical protein